MNRRVLMIALAVMLALAGTGAVFAYVRQADSRALAGTQAADVLVVQKLIPAGTTVSDVLSSGYLKAERVPTSSAPTDAVSSLSSTSSTLVANADLQPGQLILRQNFSAAVPTTSGLVIPDKMLAVSFSVSTPADVAAYIQPKSEIAIFDSYPAVPTAPSAIKGDVVTRLLMTSVQVLAVSAPAPKSTGTATGAGKFVVTVALNQADAERLVHEQYLEQTGSVLLHVALLSQTSKVAPTNGVDSLGIVGPIFPATTTTTSAP